MEKARIKICDSFAGEFAGRLMALVALQTIMIGIIAAAALELGGPIFGCCSGRGMPGVPRICVAVALPYVVLVLGLFARKLYDNVADEWEYYERPQQIQVSLSSLISIVAFTTVPMPLLFMTPGIEAIIVAFFQTLIAVTIKILIDNYAVPRKKNTRINS